MIKISPLRLFDLDACYELSCVALDGLWSRSQWEAEILDEKSIVLGLFSDQDLRGVICGSLIIDEVHLIAIAVHSQHRRKGFAKLLLSHLLIKARASGASTAMLEVSNKNHAAKAVYKTFGFQTSGYRHNYYKDGSDAVMQSLSL